MSSNETTIYVDFGASLNNQNKNRNRNGKSYSNKKLVEKGTEEGSRKRTYNAHYDNKCLGDVTLGWCRQGYWDVPI